MIAADAQKYFTLRVQRGLITSGMFRYIRHPNYLGEMMKSINQKSVRAELAILLAVDVRIYYVHRTPSC
jgi:steroid 5-alpha reductase family enzyme